MRTRTDLWDRCPWQLQKKGKHSTQLFLADQDHRMWVCSVLARNVLQSGGIACLVAMLAQRQLPWGPITSLLGLPFSAYTGTCHKRVALQSELYFILCLLLAGRASSSDAVVLERFALWCMTGDHVPSAVASCRILPCGHKSRPRHISYQIINCFGRTTAWRVATVPCFSERYEHFLPCDMMSHFWIPLCYWNLSVVTRRTFFFPRKTFGLWD